MLHINLIKFNNKILMINNSKNKDLKENNNLYLNFGFYSIFFIEIKNDIYIIEKNLISKILSTNVDLAL